MPNWCSNTLVISKATNPQIERIIAAATREELLNEFLPQPIWESTPDEEGVLPGPRYKVRYFDRATGRTRAWTTGPAFPDGSHDSRWYDWSVSHWGTKWDVGEVSITQEGSDLFLSFNTAWSPVSNEWLEALAAAIPGAQIRNTFSEPGCDFYGFSQVNELTAHTHIGDISTIRDEWIKANFSQEQIEIFNDENHEDHYEVYDEIFEAWWDVETDQLDREMSNCALVCN